jgi:hypothetical protein
VEQELDFLRYFYKAAASAMGPADGEIYDSIKEDYVASGKQLPQGYGPEE